MAAAANVLIVGAGMAGMTLGVALKRAGIACEIAEIRPRHQGRAIVIGDAAHTTTPHLASGASIGIEDSVVLARFLEAGGEVPAVLQDFTAHRYDRCRMIVENSELLGEWEKNPGAQNADTVGVVARSYKALAQPV